MIQANELRLGNWVLSHITQWPTQIDWLAIKHISEGNIQAHFYGNSPVYDPIPLTPEILEKAGFEKKDGWFYKDAFMLGFITTEDNLQTEYKLSGLEDNIWKVLDVKHLHQLQNLYFALTGEELEITL